MGFQATDGVYVVGYQPSRMRIAHGGITPYYGYHLLSAIANVGQRTEALARRRSYWGGMLAEGATSSWEAYDPRWPKADPHRFLQARDGS